MAIASMKSGQPAMSRPTRQEGRPALIDFGSATVLPALADCHTHLMARIPDTPDGYVLNLANKSEAFRAPEGAADRASRWKLGLQPSSMWKTKGQDTLTWRCAMRSIRDWSTGRACR